MNWKFLKWQNSRLLVLVLPGILLGATTANEVKEESIATESQPPQTDSPRKENSINNLHALKPVDSLKDIVIPAGYDKGKYYDSFPDPLVALRVIVLEMTVLESKQKCNVSLVVTVEWTDGRLRVSENSSIPTNYARAPKSILEEFWMPRPNVFYQPSTSVYSNPEVPYWNNVNDTRVHWKKWESAECPSCVRFSAMNFGSNMLNLLVHANINYRYFPNDKHICKFLVRAGRLDKEGHDTQVNIPVNYRRSIVLAGNYKEDLAFHTRIASTGITLAADNKTIEEIDYQILFNRKMEHYVYQVYLPSGMFVVIGSLSMLLPPEIAADRVTLCATTLLTVTTFFNAAKQTGPVVSQLRALEIWLLGSIFFVFLMLFQSIAVLRMAGRKFSFTPKQSASLRSRQQSLESITTHFNKIVDKKSEAGSTHEPSIHEANGVTTGSPPDASSPPNKSMKIAEIFDRVSFMGFLLGFGISQGIYWNWLLNSLQQGCDLHHDYCSEAQSVDTDEFWNLHQNYSNYSFAPYCSNPHLLNCY